MKGIVRKVYHHLHGLQYIVVHLLSEQRRHILPIFFLLCRYCRNRVSYCNRGYILIL